MLVFLSELMINLFINYFIRVENYSVFSSKIDVFMFHYRQKKTNSTIARRRRVFQQSATITALENLKPQNGEFSISTINLLFIF